ncbi:hypothetical protein LINGRAHAP2_LOCUS27846, partial [Linum grandiflorum]
LQCYSFLDIQNHVFTILIYSNTEYCAIHTSKYKNMSNNNTILTDINLEIIHNRGFTHHLLSLASLSAVCSLLKLLSSLATFYSQIGFWF